jgi:hypothetical protein
MPGLDELLEDVPVLDESGEDMPALDKLVDDVPALDKPGEDMPLEMALTMMVAYMKFLMEKPEEELPQEMGLPMVVAPMELLVELPEEELPRRWHLLWRWVSLEEAPPRVVALLKVEEVQPVEALPSEEEPVERPQEMAPAYGGGTH